METDWVTQEASEFCSSVRDGTHDSPKEVTEGGKNLVTSRHIKGGILDFTNSYKISTKDFNEINQRSKVNQWDVLFSMIGTIGEVLLVKEKEPDYAIKNVGLFKCKSELDGQWLYYFLNSPPVKREILSLSRGTTQQYIPLGSLRKLSISCPNSDLEKEKIIRFLSNIDEKIDLNKKTNEILEEIAKALFKSWFIDFDPVKAKAEGRSTGLPDEISDLFPNSFEDSDIGKIPKGWEVKKLGQIIEFAYGKPLKESERINGSFAVFGSNGKVGTHVEYLVKGPGIIVGRKGNPGIVKWSDDNFFPIDTTFYVKPKSDISAMTFLFFALLNQKLSNLSADSAVPGLNRNIAYMNQQVIPSSDVISLFEEHVRELFLREKINNLENSSLHNLRDSLLPKIISGELRIADTEKIIEEIS